MVLFDLICCTVLRHKSCSRRSSQSFTSAALFSLYGNDSWQTTPSSGWCLYSSQFGSRTQKWCQINDKVHLEKPERDFFLRAMLHTLAKAEREKKTPKSRQICHFGLTGAFVEFACLCDIPFAQSGSLANGWTHSIHIVAWQDGVQEDSSANQQDRERRVWKPDITHTFRLSILVGAHRQVCSRIFMTHRHPSRHSQHNLRGFLKKLQLALVILNEWAWLINQNGKKKRKKIFFL